MCTKLTVPKYVFDDVKKQSLSPICTNVLCNLNYVEEVAKAENTPA